SCWLAGGEECARKLRELAAADVEVHEVSCVGRGDRAPAAVVNGVPVPTGNLDEGKRWGAEPSRAPTPPPRPPRRWACDPYGKPEDRYATINRARRTADFTRQAVATLKSTGLRGMGGAGFPAGTKAELVAKESRKPKYVICNADESEPGTFKD